MSSHCFHEIYIHLNWHCDRDMKMIHPDWEPKLHEFFKEYCEKFVGVFYHGSNGTEDHVHLVIQIEPTVQISDFVGKIKGASSFEINKKLLRKALVWQRGYGAVSFAKNDLPGVLRYVANQKEHHAAGTTKNTLEIGTVYLETDFGWLGLAEALRKHAKAVLASFFWFKLHHLKVVANRSLKSAKADCKLLAGFVKRAGRFTLLDSRQSNYTQTGDCHAR